MIRSWVWMACCVVAFVANVALGAEPISTKSSGIQASAAIYRRSCGPCCCPDDYCSKPLPCVKCPCRGCCDDYCNKPLPCVKCPPRGCCDDYCKKPWCLPSYCRVPGYTCGPPDRCYSCKK